ncbi:MAG: 3'-5' exonuclease [Muribaculum sp.]|nr:3'-5' exonuclease [Muribaculum sp.]
MKLNITRPLIFFDLETTGTDIAKDRIVEISYVKLIPGKEEPEKKTRRLNPEMPIPAAATAVHHITDEDVRDEPTFRQIAKSLLSIFDGCDIAGYNSNKFDLPLLIEEFSRVGMPFDLAGRRLIDVQNIFYKKEPRTLTGALRFYCGKELDNAHSALADTEATLEVLMGQLDKYDDLQNDIDWLADFSRMNRNVDLAGRIILDDDNEPVFNFGKHKGEKLRNVWKHDRSFFDWMLQGTFAKNTKDEIMKFRFKMMNSK